MVWRRLAGAVLLAGLLAPDGARAATDAALLRLFLTDGTVLTTFGEFARVGDRVVFSMPTAASANPPLHLVAISADRVDWERTNRYAASVRATRYLETQADTDYAELSNQVANAITEATSATDPTKRLQIVETARKILADWPQSHYNHRQADVRQMLAMLDEVVADLRAATGAQRFDLSLTAFVDAPSPALVAILPDPTPKESVEQILAASRLVDTPVERTSLLAIALSSLTHDASALPPDWATKTLAETRTAIRKERRIDRTYGLFSKQMVAVANVRQRALDVRGLERVLTRIGRRDVALGRKRPDVVSALLTTVQDKLDAARQLQLAHDRWALRAPALRSYRNAVRPAIDRFVALKPALENIKLLASTPPAALAALQATTQRIAGDLSRVAPPEELRSAHAALISAVQLAGHAGKVRREAVLAADVGRAWDASSAAAGALMLGARARGDIQRALRPPQAR